MENRFVYADNAATTKLNKDVLNAMMPYLTEHYGNPSSIYKLGRDNKIAINNAREVVANSLGCAPNEIFFTAGGSESDNWAIKGIASSLKEKGRHIITTNFEHHAVLHTLQALEKEGFEVTYLPVDENGLINPQDVEKAIRPDTILITIMFANNEIGTIMPIAEIGKIAKAHKVAFHTDAVQAYMHIPINCKEMNIDMLSFSGHKFGGPKGIGGLYIRRGLRIANHIHGGGQETGRRAGTENVPGIIGLAKAVEIASANMESEIKRLTAMRDKLIDGILTAVPNSRLNGDRYNRLPGNVNISFEFIEGEGLLLFLDMAGICASSGSACTSGDLDPSHVLLAIGLPHEKAHGSLRLSLGADNTMEDVEYIIEKIPPIVQRLRDMSPLYNN